MTGRLAFIFGLVLAGLFFSESAQGQESDLTVVSSTTKVECTSLSTATLAEQCEYVIRNEQGFALSRFIKTLEKGHDLLSFQMTVKDGAGNTLRQFKKTDLKRTSLSTEFSTDAYTLYVDYVPPVYPVSITLQWKERWSDGFLDFPVFSPLPGYRTDAIYASYTLSLPDGMDCQVEQRNTDAKVACVESEDGRRQYRVEMTNLKSIEKEPFSPEWDKVAPHLYFVPRQFNYHSTQGQLLTWSDFGSWQRQLMEGRRSLPAEVKQMVHQLTDTCHSVRQKVACLYDYLAKTTRYVSIQLGIGGLQPAPAIDVARTGFGDCKGLSNYMCAMLAEADIPSAYVIVSTVNKQVPKDVPLAGIFNHVVCAVPSDTDTIWIECTAPEMPLGYVHRSIVGHDALWIGEYETNIVQIPQSNAIDNIQHIRLHVSIADGGGANLELQLHASMQRYEALAFLTKWNDERKKEWVLGELDVPSLKVSQLDVSNQKKPYEAPSLALSATLSTPNFSSVSGSRLFIPCSPFRKDRSALSSVDHRKLPVYIPFGGVEEDTVTYDIPEHYAIEVLPAPVCMSGDVGSFSFSVHVEGHSVIVVSRFILNEGEFPPAQYAFLRSLMLERDKMERQKIVLRKEI